MTAAVLFWINGDAELELAAGPEYRRSKRMAAHCQALAAELADDLVRFCPGFDVRVAAPGTVPDHRAALAVPWCPTPDALTTCRAVAARVVDTPAVDIVRRVNHRQFAADCMQELPGSRFCTTVAEVEGCLRHPPPVAADGWFLKRPLGFSGRGRKHLRGLPSAADRRWIEASLEQPGGGLQVEPRVAVESEWALHGWVAPDQLVLGAPAAFATEPDGAWAGRHPAPPPLGGAEVEHLLAGATAVAEALRAAGYFGPFGMDAFRWRDRNALRWRRAGDINARWTMALPAALTAAGYGFDPRTSRIRTGCSPTTRHRPN